MENKATLFIRLPDNTLIAPPSNVVAGHHKDACCYTILYFLSQFYTLPLLLFQLYPLLPFCGYFTLASDGVEAISLFAQKKYDLVLLDILLQKYSVFNAFQRPRDDLNVRPIA